MTSLFSLRYSLFLLLLLILVVLFWFGVKRKEPLFSGRHSQKILLVYCAVLIVAGATVYLLPTTDFIKDQGTSEEFFAAENAEVRLLDIAKEGGLDSNPGIYKISRYIYPLTGKTLLLKVDPQFNGTVAIDRPPAGAAAAAEPAVEVGIYTTRFYVFNNEITGHVKLPAIVFGNNALQIAPPQRYALNFIGFTDNFTARQFFDNSAGTQTSFYFSGFGRQIIVLRVPKDIKVSTEGPVIDLADYKGM